MKKKIFGGIAVLAIAAVAAINVNLSSQSNDLASLTLAKITTLANAEALAGESNKKGYDEDTQTSKHYSNGVLYKESEIITCHAGGPKSRCTESCKYKLLKEDGSWTDWMYI